MGISFFEAIFNDTIFNTEGDTQICCPFPHKAGENIYYELNPSAGINITKGVFHCFTCGRAYSETAFAALKLGTTYDKAAKYLQKLHRADDLLAWSGSEKNLKQNDNLLDLIKNKLHISEEVINELHLGYQGGNNCFTIPIIMYDQIMDYTTYRPGEVPKYVRQKDSISGLICPFDLWAETSTNKSTLICAGEKDMMIARTYGFNAITFTGGETNTPEMFLPYFKDRKTYIIYDNDEAGRLGAKKLALKLKGHAKSVHVVDISETCKENKEDLWDYFCKYSKTREDLIKLLKETPEYTEEDFVTLKKELYPIVSLKEAIESRNYKQIKRSSIQVIATADNCYVAPTYIIGQKDNNPNNEGLLEPGTRREWMLSEENYKDLFYMIDSNLKENSIKRHIRSSFLGIPEKELGVTITNMNDIPIYKCTITDLVESYSSSAPTEFIAYSLNNKLENGKKYIATYKLVPHPQDGQKLIMVIKDVEESDDFLTSFKVTDDIKESLKKFQVEENQTTKEKLDYLLNLTKGIIKADYNETLVKVIDIWYHSVLQFSVGNFKDIRGYIDCLIIGESRTGKSSTVEALQKVYGVGKVASLAGAAATTAGLIGGSEKIGAGSYQTRAGLIPQNNRGAIIFEELAKCRSDFIKELTDIRSSNKVRITRVNGTIELPAYVRMLTLTNPKTFDNIPRPITSYPNGIELLTENIGTPEDIARYDMIAIFGFTAPKEIDPYYESPTPFPDIDYQNRIRWIWSRTQEQIYISKEVYNYTVKRANELNKIYGTFINIFGVEAWKKILRIAIAIAGYLCSTNETFEEIVVNNDHVDEAISLLITLYDNQTFKLREYVLEEQKYNTVTPEDILVLQNLYKEKPELIDYLYKNTQTTKTNLQMACELPNDVISKYTSKLLRSFLIKIDKAYIITANKFVQCYNLIDKDLSKLEIQEQLMEPEFSYDKD